MPPHSASMSALTCAATRGQDTAGVANAANTQVLMSEHWSLRGLNLIRVATPMHAKQIRDTHNHGLQPE